MQRNETWLWVKIINKKKKKMHVKNFKEQIFKR